MSQERRGNGRPRLHTLLLIGVVRRRQGGPSAPCDAMRLVLATRPRAALLAGMYAALSTGAFYGFAIYSPALKRQLHLSQAELVNINTVPYAFGVVSVLWGALTQRVGFRVAFLLGGSLLAGSQLLLYCLAMRIVEPPKMLPLPIALVVVATTAFFGLQLVSSACFTAPVQHFPQFRGLASSIVKAFVGLGGAVTTQLFVLIWGAPSGDATAFNALLLWASLSLIVNLLAAIAMPSGARPDANAEPHRMLTAVFVCLVLLGACATLVTVPPPTSMAHTSLAYALLALSVAPVVLIFAGCLASPDEAATSRLSTRSALRPKQAEVTDTIGDDEDGSPVIIGKPLVLRLSASGSHSCSTFESPVAYELCEMVATPEAWLVVFCGSVILGAGNVLATNMAQILESASGPPALLPTLVTLFSTGNLLGRLLCNLPSDAMVRRGWPRPFFLAAIAGLACLAHLALLAGAIAGASTRHDANPLTAWITRRPQAADTAVGALQSALLQGGALAGGLAFGAIWPHFVVLASELFGSRHLAMNYMFFDGVSGATGTMLLANALPALVYARAAGAGKHDCVGALCFGPTHGVIAALCVCAMGAAAIVGCRSQTLYRQIANDINRAAMGAAEKPTGVAEML